MPRWFDNLLNEVISHVVSEENFTLPPESAQVLLAVCLPNSIVSLEAAIISSLLIDLKSPELRPSTENLKRILMRNEGIDNPRLYKAATRLGVTL